MIFSCYLLGSFWGSYETIMSFDVLILIALIITFHLFSKNSDVVVMIVKLYGFFFNRSFSSTNLLFVFFFVFFL